MTWILSVANYTNEILTKFEFELVDIIISRIKVLVSVNVALFKVLCFEVGSKMNFKIYAYTCIYCRTIKGMRLFVPVYPVVQN